MLDWRDGQPVSPLYQDVYFSSASGIEEAQHVFLQGNRLAERFAGVAPGDRFAIGETGFGTGLNFLSAWALWDRSAPHGARLHYVSAELHPLSGEELAQCLALWPVLQPYARALCARYGPLAPGWHRLRLGEGRVLLTLLVGDARETVPALRGAVDAWFLDGFSPARNPQMWEASLLQAIARHSAPGATFATYTCAGEVRRALGAAGFRVEKTAGFGPKREMLRGALPGAPCARPPAVREAVVIGGGLAGTSAAGSLADRGWKVTLLERDAALAAQASGNAQGVLYAKLSSRGTPLSDLVLAGYQHSLRVLRERLVCDAEQWSDCPVLQLACDRRDAKRQAGVLARGWPHEVLHGVDAQAASACAGLPLSHGGLLFPGGGWVHPPALCRALAGVPGVEVRTHQRAVRLASEGGIWKVLDAERCIASAPVVVVAAAESSSRFDQIAHLPLRTNRGQVTLIRATSASALLTAVLCANRYAAPARAGWHSVGATLGRETSCAMSAADNAENLASLRRLFPPLFEALGGIRLAPAALRGRAALRCASPDYLPLVGPVEGPEQEPLPGLYLSTAHGSRGLITAPLGGEMLAACLEDEPAPLSDALMRATDPRRFAPGASRGASPAQ